MTFIDNIYSARTIHSSKCITLYCKPEMVNTKYFLRISRINAIWMRAKNIKSKKLLPQRIYFSRNSCIRILFHENLQNILFKNLSLTRFKYYSTYFLVYYLYMKRIKINKRYSFYHKFKSICFNWPNVKEAKLTIEY